MPKLDDCPECGSPIPLRAPGGLCPSCLLQLGLEAKPCLVETPLTVDSDSTGLHDGESTGDTTAEHAEHTNSTGPCQSAEASRRFSSADQEDGHITLGNLEVLEEIGRGGMGVVYRARQRLANREVAVKVLSRNLANRRDIEERFSAEIEALAGLRHPNIVAVHEVGEDAGCVYFSMELIRGGSLSRRLKSQPITPLEAATIIEQLAEAVHTAHELGLIHRDIKPGNVLMADDGSPKLSDFGLAKWIGNQEGLTETGAVLGTPSYMAPEQAAGSGRGTLGPAADVYGLGATLYELLTGRPPFRGDNSFETIKRVLDETPAPPRSVNPGIHQDLEAVCLKCLEKDPVRRYATAQELANDLHRWRMGDATRARPLSLRRRVWRAVRRRWRWFASAGVISAAVTAGIILATKSPPSADEAMRALKKGKPVTLIGETGAPQFHRWVVGVGEAGEHGAMKQFMVFAVTSGLVELVPDSQTDRYRLSAEYQVDSSVGLPSSAGVYFAHRQSVLGGGVGVDRAVVVSFTDDLINNKRASSDRLVPNMLDFVNVFDTLYYTLPEGGFRNDPFPVGSLRVEDPINPENGTKRRDLIPWRKIVATVGPDELQVQWRDPDGSFRPVGIEVFRKPPKPAIPTSTLVARDEPLKSFLRKTYPGIDTSGFSPFSSRGGVGLYVYNARVLFRNVVVEPLPH